MYLFQTISTEIKPPSFNQTPLRRGLCINKQLLRLQEEKIT